MKYKIHIKQDEDFRNDKMLIPSIIGGYSVAKN